MHYILENSLNDLNTYYNVNYNLLLTQFKALQERKNRNFLNDSFINLNLILKTEINKNKTKLIEINEKINRNKNLNNEIFLKLNENFLYYYNSLSKYFNINFEDIIINSSEIYKYVEEKDPIYLLNKMNL